MYLDTLPYPMPGWLSVPKDWVASFGDIVKFSARVFGEIFRGRVFRFFGEAQGLVDGLDT